jgi:hypothetical protein
MSKQHRTAGVDFRVETINGKDYTLRPLTLGVYAEMEAYIISQRPDPLAVASAAVSRLPQSQHKAIWDAAMEKAVSDRVVSTEQAKAFEDSLDGLCWKLWQCLKQDHPEINSVQAARDLMLEAGEEHFEKLAYATELASGEADIKKSSGPAEDRADRVQDGQSSTDSSPKPTDGAPTKSTV